MKPNMRISTFFAVFMLVGLVLPLISSNVASGVVIPAGCCTTEDGGGQCVACPEGEICLTSEDFCESQDGFLDTGACIDEGQGAACTDFEDPEGCCVVEPGSCIDETDFDDCFLDFSSSELWVSGASCSEVPQCEVVRNIPTMSTWGLIALAAVFVLVGVWAITRKKAQT